MFIDFLRFKEVIILFTSWQLSDMLNNIMLFILAYFTSANSMPEYHVVIWLVGLALMKFHIKLINDNIGHNFHNSGGFDIANNADPGIVLPA